MPRIQLPGLTKERYRSGNIAWRVRPVGEKWRKITVPAPDHPDFMAAYEAARRGIKLEIVRDRLIPKSMAWLVSQYNDSMNEQLSAGLLSEATVKQRRAFYERICAKFGDKSMAMPKAELIKYRDGMMKTPGAADNMIKAVRALYAWANERGILSENPALGISKINRGTGAIPWSIDDLAKFRKRHPCGAMAHLALSLFMFTSTRISDIVLLGRSNEVMIDGSKWLEWQPAKKGSAPVSVPILPPLAKSIEAQKVIGPTYLLTQFGKPFASSAAFGNWFRDRVNEAGMKGLSAHGIRKASGELMAISGASQYHIMAVHGHTNAKTSEVYTRDVNRKALAKSASEKLAKMEW